LSGFYPTPLVCSLFQVQFFDAVAQLSQGQAQRARLLIDSSGFSAGRWRYGSFRDCDGCEDANDRNSGHQFYKGKAVMVFFMNIPC